MRCKLRLAAIAAFAVVAAACGPSTARAQAIFRGMPDGLGMFGNRWLFEPPYNGGANFNQTPTPDAYDVYAPVNPYLYGGYYYRAYPSYRYSYHRGPAVDDRPETRRYGYGWW
jgi:hypothetical protein